MFVSLITGMQVWLVDELSQTFNNLLFINKTMTYNTSVTRYDTGVSRRIKYDSPSNEFFTYLAVVTAYRIRTIPVTMRLPASQCRLKILSLRSFTPFTDPSAPRIPFFIHSSLRSKWFRLMVPSTIYQTNRSETPWDGLSLCCDVMHSMSLRLALFTVTNPIAFD